MPVGVDVAASSQALSWQFNHRRKAFVSGGAAGLQTQLRASAALRSVRLRLPSASQISRAFPHFPGSATSSQYVGYAPLACYGGRPRLRGKWKRSGQPVGRARSCSEPHTYADAYPTAEAAASHAHAYAGARRVVARPIRRIAVTVRRGSNTSRDGRHHRQDAEKSEHDHLPCTNCAARDDPVYGGVN